MQGQGGILGPEAGSPCYRANCQGRVSESLKDQPAGQPSSISPHVYEPIAPWGPGVETIELRTQESPREVFLPNGPSGKDAET